MPGYYGTSFCVLNTAILKAPLKSGKRERTQNSYMNKTADCGAMEGNYLKMLATVYMLANFSISYSTENMAP